MFEATGTGIVKCGVFLTGFMSFMCSDTLQKYVYFGENIYFFIT